MVDVETKEINYQKVEEMKEYLLKSPNHFGGHRFTAMMKEFSQEEKQLIFNDPRVMKRVHLIVDYDTLASVFRSVPADIQELIWANEVSQKVLLGIGVAQEVQVLYKIKQHKFFAEKEMPKKEKRNEFYFNGPKLRALDVLLRYVKSPNIIKDLHTNKYFHMILMCSKKVPDSMYSSLNVEELFYNIVNSSLYPQVPIDYKSVWCTHINRLTPKLLLPSDHKRIYSPMDRFETYFWGDKGTLGAMLKSKVYSLGEKGLKLDIDSDTLRKLNLFEINVLKADDKGVVDQESVNDMLRANVLKGIEDGSVFNEDYLNTRYLNVPVQCAIFRLVIQNTIGNPKCEERMLNYLFSKLFTNEYSEEVKRVLMISLKNAIIHTSEKDIANLFMYASDVKSAFFLRFNLTAERMDYLHGFTVDQLLKLNVKHINRLVKLLYDAESDELSEVYMIAIKMYFVFGLEKAVELASTPGVVNKKFRDNVSRLNVKEVEMKPEGKRYLPIIHEEFNRFLFATDNIKALCDKETALNAVWYYLYNNFNEIKELCHGHINLVQAEIILKEQVGKVKYDLPPDCDALEPILYEAGLGNKGHSYTNEQVYDKMCDMYRKQFRRTKSAIPYVEGTMENGWRYEVMRHDDVIAYVLGYRAGCCIRTGDIAHNHLLHALHSEYGRILIVYKPNGDIASFSPLKRNGEVLIANSIEAVEKEHSFTQRIVDTFKAGMIAICKESKRCEEVGINVATIGSDSSRKPTYEDWPYYIKAPTILEKDDPVYANTDQYHRSQKIVYRTTNNLEGLKYGEVEERYYDPRKPIKGMVHHYSYNDRGVLEERRFLKSLEAIHYMKCQDDGVEYKPMQLGFYTAAFCNDDWFVIVGYDGRITSLCLDYDERARKEMNAVIEVIHEYQNNKEDVRKLALEYKQNRPE